MSSRNKKDLQKKLQKYNEVIGGGKNALDDLDFDEENVYDEIDEEAYGRRAESIREASFVVDDDGLGYDDDGEEHLFDDEEDELGKRSRALEMKNDDKAQKKSRKLMEALASSKQTNNIKGFLKSTTGAGVKPVMKESMPANSEAVDVDDFFGSVNATTAASGYKPKASSAASLKPNPMMQRAHNNQFRPGMPMRSQPTFNASEDRVEASEGHYDDDNNNNNNDDYMEPSSSHADYSAEDNTEQHSSTSMDTAANSHSDHQNDFAKEETATTAVAATVVSNKMPQLKATKKFTMADMEESKPPVVSNESASEGAAGGGGPSVGKLDPSKWLFNLSSDSKAGVKAETAAMETAGGGGIAASAAAASGDNFVKMFWLDAYENNGIIYLFGKIALVDGSPPVSGCVAVHGCQRNLFVLPRVKGDVYSKSGQQERFSAQEVFGDINKVMSTVIPNQSGASFKCKMVKRSYVFECGDVPREELDYMKISYSSKFGVPNQNVCTNGGKTFQRMFGAGSTPLEWFLLKRELMGPCWIQIKAPKPMLAENVSWCKIEMSVDDPKNVIKIRNAPPSPNLTTMSISMKTVVNPSTHVHEIVAIAGLVHTKVDADAETNDDPKFLKRFAYVRQLNQSCGSNYPAVFPHDFAVKAKQTGFVQTFTNERAMLSRFFVEIGITDPDIICSHNLFGFEFEILLNRAVENKVPDWSRLGRIRRAKAPRATDRDLTPGRVLCDTYKSAKEFLRETNYSLTHLVKSQLGADREEIEPVDTPSYFVATEGLLKLAHIAAMDAQLVHRLTVKLQVVPLTKQLTVVAGNLWGRTMRGGKAERNEYLLLHQFHNGIYESAAKTVKYILPEKKSFGDNSSGGKSKFKNAMDEDDDEPEVKVGGVGRKRAKAAYAGGLVLEPKKGLYDSYILLLDFNSLYPSIIQEYNLCFTTIDWTKYMFDEKKEATAGDATPSKDKKVGGSAKSTSAMAVDNAEDAAPEEDEDDDDDEDGEANSGNKALPPIPDSQVQGVLPRVIKELVARRKEVKKLLKDAKDPAEKQSLDIRQKAYKLTANSMYGCLGFSFSRFYARPIAALVTAKGREALQRTVEQAETQMGYTVIYGDTDSVMINTNCTDLQVAKDIGVKIRQEVNKMYKTLELDTDGIMKSMLLLKKKKYAALMINEGKDGKVTYEHKMSGLDLVRRDWCPLSKETGTHIVEEILSGNPRHEIVIAIHEYLDKLQQDIRGNVYPLEKYIITKGLNKNPKDYPDVKGQPHLQVALAMIKANKPVNIGDHIPYVICKEGDEGSSHVLRAHHPDEIERSEGKLTVDYEWYLNSQILPPVQRLCEPIEGTSPSILAKQLGLDSTKFNNNTRRDEEDEWGFNAAKVYMEDNERFADCDPLMVMCRGCEQAAQFPGLSSENASNVGSLSCPNCNVRFYGYDDTRGFASYISNRITLVVRHAQKMYYECWLKCDDTTCGRRTMQQSTRNFDRCTENCHGKMEPEYSDMRMYNQIKYLQSLFDIDRLTSRAAIIDTPEMKAKLVTVKNFNEKQISFFKDVKGVITQLVESSGYNWIMPSIWTMLRNSSKK